MLFETYKLKLINDQILRKKWQLITLNHSSFNEATTHTKIILMGLTMHIVLI